MSPARRDDCLIVLGGLASLALLLLNEQRVAGATGLPLDDSWIHLHFARNIAEGAGFSYNPGRPVAGSTAPLWTLLIALASRVGASPLLAAKGLGIFFYLLSAISARRLALAVVPERWAGLLAGLGTILMGRMAWGALSGMEVPLAATLVTLSFLGLTRGAAWWPWVGLGLAALARPEALLLTPLALLVRPRRVGSVVGRIFIVGAILFPRALFSLTTVGSVFPATAVAKVEGGLLGLLAGTRGESLSMTFFSRPFDFLSEWGRLLLDDQPLFLLLIPAGLINLWRRRRRIWVALGALLILHPIGMALLAPYRGPAFQEGRYSSHLLPFFVVMAVCGVAWIRDLLGRRVIALAFIAWLAIEASLLWPASLRYAWGVQNINAMQVHLGRWVDRELPRDARLAVNDVGAIAFFSRREVIDLMGLVTPEILPYRRQGETGILHNLEQVCPDYLIIFPNWFPQLSARRDLFTEIYSVHLNRNLVSGGDTMVVYETVWNRWRVDVSPCPRT